MTTVDVLMPKMGESITEGTVIAWYKKVGEEVALDELLLEIGTDKVDTEIPSPDAGVVAEILVPEGETVDVGTPIARIRTGVAEEIDKEASLPPSPPVPAPQLPHPAAPSAHAPVEVVMPKMGESITEGTVIAWRKKVGEEVALDELLLEIGTDKVDTEVPSPAAGTLIKILVPENKTVDVGAPLALIASGEYPTAPAPAPVVVEQESPQPEPQPPAPATVASGRHLGDGRFLTPLVRTIAQREGVSAAEIERIKGSGRSGRVTKQDLLGYLEARKKQDKVPEAKPQPQVMPPSEPGAREVVVEMDRLRQLVAHHMTLSRKTAAHVTSFAEVDATNLVRLREANKKKFFERDGIKLTYTPFLVYAAVEALRDHPILNASVDGTKIIYKKDHHIGIAVNINKTGLIVPVIKHAGRQRVAGLAHAAHDLASRARANDLQPDDLQGGTFTITNLGSLGSIMGTPIILQPQVAILATGAIKKRPVVVEDPELGDIIAIRYMMYLSLSYDHRIIDGAMGISFLRKFSAAIEGFDPKQKI